MKISRQPFMVKSAPGVTLKGEMTLPADLEAGEKRPAVILLGEKPLKTMAETLSEAGVIAVRYDQRNGSVSDAQAVLEQVRQDARVDKVALLGHSEGNSIAAALAASGTPLAGIIMMNLVAEPFQQVTQAAPHLSGVPILLMAGEDDLQASPALPTQKKLQSLGLTSQLKTYPGHFFSPSQDGEAGSIDTKILQDLKGWTTQKLVPPKLQPATFGFKPRKTKFWQPVLGQEQLREASAQLGETETLRRALLMNHKMLARTPFQEMTDDHFAATLKRLKEAPYSSELLAPTAQLAARLYRRAGELPYNGYEGFTQEAPEAARERADGLGSVLAAWHRAGEFTVTEGGHPQSTDWFLQQLRKATPGATPGGLEFLRTTSADTLKRFYQNSDERRAIADQLEAQARKDPGTGARFFRETRDAYLSKGDGQLFREFGIFLEEAIKRPQLNAQFRQIAPEILNLYAETERFGLTVPDSEIRVNEVNRIIYPVPELAGEALTAESLVPYLSSPDERIRDRAAGEIEIAWINHPQSVTSTMDWIIEQSPATRWSDTELLGARPREALPWELAQVAAERHGWKPQPEQQDWMQAVQATQVRRNPHPPALQSVVEALEHGSELSSEELLKLHTSIEGMRDQAEGQFHPDAPWMDHLATQLGVSFPLEAGEVRAAISSFPWKKLERADAPLDLRSQFALLNSQTKNRPELRRQFIDKLGDGIRNVTQHDFRALRSLTGEWSAQQLEPVMQAKDGKELVQQAAQIMVEIKGGHSFQFTTRYDDMQRAWDTKIAEFGIERSTLRRHARNLWQEIAVLGAALQGDPEKTLDRLDQYNQLKDALPKLEFDQADRLFQQAQAHPWGWDEGLKQVVDTVVARKAQVKQVMTLIPELGKKKELAPKLAEQARSHPDGWEAGFQALKADLELKREQLKELAEHLPDLKRDHAEELVEKARNHPDGWETGLQKILRSAVEGFPDDEPTPTEILLGEDFLQIGDFEVPVQD